MTQDEDAIDFHESLARTWGDKYAKASFRKRVAAFEEMLPCDSLLGQNWLDAGCGSGVMSEVLAVRGAEVFGVDGAPAMIEEAKKKCRRFSKCRFESISDLECWQPDETHLDGIVCSSVLEYLRSPEATLLRFAEWTQPAGFILLSVPNSKSIIRKSQKLSYSLRSSLGLKPTPEYLRHSKHDFSRSSIVNILANAGFAEIRTRFFGVPRLPALFESWWTSPLMIVLAQKIP